MPLGTKPGWDRSARAHLQRLLLARGCSGSQWLRDQNLESRDLALPQCPDPSPIPALFVFASINTLGLFSLAHVGAAGVHRGLWEPGHLPRGAPGSLATVPPARHSPGRSHGTAKSPGPSPRVPLAGLAEELGAVALLSGVTWTCPAALGQHRRTSLLLHSPPEAAAVLPKPTVAAKQTT